MGWIVYEMGEIEVQGKVNITLEEITKNTSNFFLNIIKTDVDVYNKLKKYIIESDDNFDDFLKQLEEYKMSIQDLYSIFKEMDFLKESVIEWFKEKMPIKYKIYLSELYNQEAENINEDTSWCNEPFCVYVVSEKKAAIALGVNENGELGEIYETYNEEYGSDCFDYAPDVFQRGDNPFEILTDKINMALEYGVIVYKIAIPEGSEVEYAEYKDTLGSYRLDQAIIVLNHTNQLFVTRPNEDLDEVQMKNKKMTYLPIEELPMKLFQNIGNWDTKDYLDFFNENYTTLKIELSDLEKEHLKTLIEKSNI